MSEITQEMLAACEKRAVELYAQAPPEKMAGECRRELEAEFGPECVKQMLANGIGNNQMSPEAVWERQEKVFDLVGAYHPAVGGRYLKWAVWELARKKYQARIADINLVLATKDAEISNLHDQLRDEKAKSRDVVAAYDEYVELLVREMNQIVTIAAAHGWKSELYEAGKAVREKIEVLKAGLTPAEPEQP